MQNKGNELITLAQRIRALCQTGLAFSNNDYEIDRCNELIGISDRIVSIVSDVKEDEIKACYIPLKEYITPKIDIRVVIFNEKDEILLVREKSDGLWSLPGGWSDVGYTPKEVAVKEAKEETGYDVRVVKLLAVLDKSCYNHPSSPFYIYKFCFLCEIIGCHDDLTFDILDRGFFALDNLPPMSLLRTLPEQIKLLDELRRKPSIEVFCD